MEYMNIMVITNLLATVFPYLNNTQVKYNSLKLTYFEQQNWLKKVVKPLFSECKALYKYIFGFSTTSSFT